MATEESGTAAHNAQVKVAFQLAVHVPVWALVLLGIATLGGAEVVRARGASEALAAMVGLAEIAFGLIAAGLGACAGFLDDSEDADNLCRERRALLLGACALVSAGASLVLSSLAGPQRLVPAAAGATGALILSVFAVVFVSARWQRLSESDRGVAREAGYLAFNCLAWVGGPWAMLAHVELAAAPAPLDWLTMLHGSGFVAGLVAVARRGRFAAIPAR